MRPSSHDPTTCSAASQDNPKPASKRHVKACAVGALRRRRISPVLEDDETQSQNLGIKYRSSRFLFNPCKYISTFSRNRQRVWMSLMNTTLIYMTVKDVSEARKLARAMLSARLAACVNILGPIEALYRWKGAIQHDGEIPLIAKTTVGKADALIRKVLSIHSYETPCIVALPILKGNPAFLRWIEKETQSSRRPRKPARIK
jgi:periplasmic divalent cation tolerance protein